MGIRKEHHKILWKYGKTCEWNEKSRLQWMSEQDRTHLKEFKRKEN